ncbi:MAG: peptidylprolyl isomerase [Gemmatimonadetes bacterium]|nr:peptidylprolyl isomerase [Gemmatimonadota bacterium]
MLALFVFLAGAASAQDSTARRDSATRQDSTARITRPFRTADRIVAVVGGKPILLSRIQEEVNIYRALGNKVPADSAEMAIFLRQLVDRLVNDELMVQAAQRDTTIKLSLQEVQAAVEDAVKNVRQQFPSDIDFQRQLRTAGFGTLEEYREWVYDQKRRENLERQYIQKLRQKGLIKPIPATEAEAKKYYEDNKGSMPHRPATVSFRQVVARPEPDSAALALALQRADSVLAQLRRGADFATLAKRVSEDPSTKDEGGELGWFRRGMGLARGFEQAAFSLRPGQISDPVRTPFGYHIIQVERIDAAEIQARHILFVPELTDANRAAAALRADSVGRAWRSGAPFDSLVKAVHDPTEDAIADNIPRDGLPEEYKTALADGTPGDIIGPFSVPSPTGTKYVVAMFQMARTEGEMTYEELRDQIRSNLGERGAMDRYLEQLRKRTYVDIRL